MQKPALLGLDFDGTTHLTSEPSPDGHTVDSAYVEAIVEHLGQDCADRYIEQGGNKHRGAAAIVAALRPNDSQAMLERLTRHVTASKLEILTESVGKPLPDGTPWPRLTPGLRELWTAIDSARTSGRLIGRAMLSAGHTDFQVKAFEIHGLSQPDIFLTADTLQALRLSMPAHNVEKPATFMLEMAQTMWAYRTGVPAEYMPTIYAGDSEEKDRVMADRMEVPFELIEPETSRQAWHRVGAFLGLQQYLGAEAAHV